MEVGSCARVSPELPPRGVGRWGPRTSAEVAHRRPHHPGRPARHGADQRGFACVMEQAFGRACTTRLSQPFRRHDAGSAGERSTLSVAPTQINRDKNACRSHGMRSYRRLRSPNTRATRCEMLRTKSVRNTPPDANASLTHSMT